MKNSTSNIGKGKATGEGSASDSVALGDVIYIKLRGGSWWPAQVVDENSVSESTKPSRKSPGEVLVRVSYVDPNECCSEFETVLKRNNGSLRDILMQALHQGVGMCGEDLLKNLPSSKSSMLLLDLLAACLAFLPSLQAVEGTSSKNSAGKRKSNKEVDENGMLNDDALASQSHEATPVGKSQELSSRRLRVMESLGLIAPAGSPFQKDHNCTTSS
ncbi:hypothetical protein RJT34_10021 [Clitoria ternatea]|uniref:PWWP domain-containing protein n=1 Tax=Clitoria ternatea TaxID=43366 RepID=A0AAN9K7K3_CLITE